MNSNHQIITDKYEMHEIAIESSLSEHKDIIHIDFAKTLLKFQPKETIKITL